MTPPSIYLHFADKDALLRAACETQFRGFDAYVERAVDGIDDPVARLMERGRAYVRFGVEHPEHYRMLFMTKATAHQPSDHLLEASGFVSLMDNVRACMDTGAMRAGDPLLVATALWTLVHGVTSLAITQPEFPLVGLDPLVDHLCQVYLAGMGPQPGS